MVNSVNKKNPGLAINGGTPVTRDIIPIHKPFFDEEDFSMVNAAIRETFVSGDGPYCRAFEKKLSEYLGAKHVLFVNSATSALELAFRVKDFPPGSEVLVPDFTYTSTALGPLYNNLKIKLVDVYEDNGSIDVFKIEKAIGSNTVGICVVDYAGIPADMDPIIDIAKRFNLYVVHDTAQSLGSIYKGKRTGTFGDVSTFSFHGTKNITTGEGGAFVTNDDDIASRVKVLREKGTDKYTYVSNNITRGYYEYVDIGNSYVQSNILGALGFSQLNKLEKLNAKRKEIADYFINNLKEVQDIDFPRITDQAVSNWHLFCILVPPSDKEWIMDALRAEGIQANVHYNPLHHNRFYSKLGTDSELPGSVRFYSRLLRLPIYPSLKESEIEHIVTAVKKIFS